MEKIAASMSDVSLIAPSAPRNKWFAVDVGKKFVNSTFLQLALREWMALLRSPRLWATFAIVVSIFVATGPSGTMDTMGLAERAAFWTFLHATAWSIAILVNTLGEIRLTSYVRGTPALLIVNATIATPLVALGVELVRWSWIGLEPTVSSYGGQLLVCLPLSVLFSLLTHMTMSAAKPAIAADLMPSEGRNTEILEPPPLLARLKPGLRGPVIHLSVEDHYTVVTTTRGRQLVLLRFSDALRELGDTDGMQTHRSHWVASAHVAGVEKRGSRLVVRLNSGGEIPVSRGYVDAVRRRFSAS